MSNPDIALALYNIGYIQGVCEPLKHRLAEGTDVDLDMMFLQIVSCLLALNKLQHQTSYQVQEDKSHEFLQKMFDPLEV